MGASAVMRGANARAGGFARAEAGLDNWARFACDQAAQLAVIDALVVADELPQRLPDRLALLGADGRAGLQAVGSRRPSSVWPRAAATGSCSTRPRTASCSRETRTRSTGAREG